MVGLAFCWHQFFLGPLCWGGSLSPGARVLQLGLRGVVALQCLFSDGTRPPFSGGRPPGSDSEVAAEQQGQRRGKCSVGLL